MLGMIRKIKISLLILKNIEIKKLPQYS